jgi:hypothetical protein
MIITEAEMAKAAKKLLADPLMPPVWRPKEGTRFLTRKRPPLLSAST